MIIKKSGLLIWILVIFLFVNIGYLLFPCWTFNCWNWAEYRCGDWCSSLGEGWYCELVRLDSDWCENTFCRQIYWIECRKEEGNKIFIRAKSIICSEVDRTQCPPPPK